MTRCEHDDGCPEEAQEQIAPVPGRKRLCKAHELERTLALNPWAFPLKPQAGIVELGIPEGHPVILKLGERIRVVVAVVNGDLSFRRMQLDESSNMREAQIVLQATFEGFVDCEETAHLEDQYNDLVARGQER